MYITYFKFKIKYFRIFLIGLYWILGCTNKSPDFAQYVNTFIGTGGHGHTFPGATTPFGMVQLSPDTRIDGSWDGCSGYHYSDSIIYGFSHTHLSGTGVSDYGDLMMMPMLSNGDFDRSTYQSTFKHSNEKSEPGYYQVRLDNEINVELTVTQRVGFHKYTFPNQEGSVIIDLMHRDQAIEKNIQIINEKTLHIKRVSSAWAKEQHAYGNFVFSKAFTSFFNEDSSKLILKFNLSEDNILLAKVGFSFVSEKGAERNLNEELPHWDFTLVKKSARESWNKELSKIEVFDSDSDKLTVFYSSLYHTMIHPNIAMDVDRHYRGMDQQIHKAEGFDYYTVFSLWDTFRATHPLYTIVDKRRTRDFIRTFLVQYEQGGRLPVWELANNETDCMIGYHSVSVIADALAKGIDDFNVDLAFEAMKKSATWDHLGLPAYQKHGFLSVDDEHESVSKTLEYAYDDWCIAQVALHLQRMDDYNNFMSRSNAWRNILDSESSLMRPRKNGGWLTPFDPREVNNHFTEGNSWQYSFFVPHDIQGLITEMGGEKLFEKKLDELFSASNETTGRTQADITGLIGQYAHGNEPSHHMAYLYNYVGAPQKTDSLIQFIRAGFYSARPEGLIGNEDCGQMSAWYVLSSLGIYPVTPGKPEYTLCKPLFDKFIIHLENGQEITQEIIFNQLKKSRFISHFELINDNASENKKGEIQSNINFLKPPTLDFESIAFRDSLRIRVNATDSEYIVYRIINEMDTLQWIQSKTTDSSIEFSIEESAKIEAYAQLGNLTSKIIEGNFYKVPHPKWKVQTKSIFNPQYSAGGHEGLIDGIHGDKNWRKGYWQGFQGQDFESIIEFQGKEQFQNVSATFLQDTRSWILMPTSVVFSISNDGKVFKEIGMIENIISPDDYEIKIEPFRLNLAKQESANYLKINAYNFGKLPKWHQGAGFDAFIFIDEIEVN